MSLLLLFMGRNIPGNYVPPVADTTPAPRKRTYFVPQHPRLMTRMRQDRVYVVPRRARTKTRD